MNYPIRLDDKISGLFGFASSGNAAPTKQVLEAYTELALQADVRLQKFDVLVKTDLPQLNTLIKQSAVPVIGLPAGK